MGPEPVDGTDQDRLTAIPREGVKPLAKMVRVTSLHSRPCVSTFTGLPRSAVPAGKGALHRSRELECLRDH